MLQTVAVLLAMPVEYGFHLSGVRLIAGIKVDFEKTIIFTTVTFVKLLIFCTVCLLALPALILSSTFDKSIMSANYLCINLVLIVFVVGFRPLWFFQGTSRYRSIIIFELLANVVSVFLLLIAIFFGVSFEQVLLLHSLPKALGVLLIHHRYISCNLSANIFTNVKKMLMESFPLFLHKISAGFLHTSIPYVLSFGVSSVALYKYQQAEKIFYVAQSFLLVLSQVGYSNVLKKKSKFSLVSQSEKWAQLNIQLVISTLAAVIIYFFAPFILNIFWSKFDDDVIKLLRLFCPLFILLGLNASLGLVFLLSVGADVAVVRAAITGAILSILFLLSTSNERSIYDGVISIYLGEFVMLITMIYEIYSMRAHERNI
jgi:O-antigen/teichoic acid export membrane protein